MFSYNFLRQRIVTPTADGHVRRSTCRVRALRDGRTRAGRLGHWREPRGGGHGLDDVLPLDFRNAPCPARLEIGGAVTRIVV